MPRCGHVQKIVIASPKNQFIGCAGPQPRRSLPDAVASRRIQIDSRRAISLRFDAISDRAFSTASVSVAASIALITRSR